MQNKNRKTLGTVGIAAIAVILSVSFFAANFSTENALAQEQQMAAKKAATSSDSLQAAPLAVTQSGTTYSEITKIGDLFIKSNDKGDWVIDTTAECAVMTHIEGKGKMDKSAGATAGANVWFELDGEKISINSGLPTTNDAEAMWNFCHQTFEIKTTLNELIERDAEGNPQFVCSLEELEANPDECQQAVELFLEIAGSYNAKVILKNVESGIHHVEVFAAIEAGPSSDYGTGSDTDGFKNASAMIGKRITIAEPIHMLN